MPCATFIAEDLTMRNRHGKLSAFVFLAAAVLHAQGPLSLDEEPHYALLLSNEYCKVYSINLGRLEETKPVAHEHDWVWLSLTGRVTEARGGTTFQSVGEPVGHEAGYSVHFRFPVKPYTLRNDHINEYQGIVVELMKGDESRYRGDPSLNPNAEFLSPGDTEKSYVNSLVKTNVEIENLQLLAGDAQEVSSNAVGHLLVAMTDVELRCEAKDAAPVTVRLSRGEVKWFADAATATYKNAGREVARFAILQMK